MQQKYFSIKAAAAYSGLSIHYLYKLTATKSLPMLKVGSRCLLPIADFDKWLEKHRTEVREIKHER